MNPSLTYELAHDMLARQVFNKFSVEEKNRRKAERLLADNQELDQTFQKEGKRRLLSAEEIGYLGPFLGQMDISPEQQGYLDESIAAVHAAEEAEKAELRRKLRQQRTILIAATGVGLAMAGMAYLIQINNTQLKQQVYDNYMTNAERLMAEDSLEKAIQMYQLAEEDAPNDEGRESAVQKKEETEQKNLAYKAFTRFIQLGDSLYTAQKYSEALDYFQEAQENGYHLQLASSKISLTQSQLQLAFDQYKKKGLAYFDVKEYKLALDWLERAFSLNEKDVLVNDRIKRSRQNLNP